MVHAVVLFLCEVVLSDLKEYMDEKYHVPVAVLTIAAFAISTFSLGQAMAVGGSVGVLSDKTQRLRSVAAMEQLSQAEEVSYVETSTADDSIAYAEIEENSYIDDEVFEGDQDAAVAAGTRRTFPRPSGVHYVCSFPGGGQIITTSPSSVQSFSYNTGSGATQSFSGEQITSGCVLVNPSTPTSTPAI